MSERGTANLLSVFMAEDGKTQADRSRIIDHICLIRRWKDKVFEEEIPTEITGLYFDGKIDSTRQRNNSFKREDHITIISETSSEFISHLIIEGRSTNKNIFDTMIDKLSITINKNIKVFIHNF